MNESQDTAHAPYRRPRRLSKRGTRAGVWLAGGTGFLALWIAIAMSPRTPATAGPVTSPEGRRVIIIKKTIRRVVVQDTQPVAPVIRYVSAPASIGGGSTPAAATTTTQGS